MNRCIFGTPSVEIIYTFALNTKKEIQVVTIIGRYTSLCLLEEGTLRMLFIISDVE